MVQQRRGLLRIWNLSLVVAAFSLTILGTFLTRSGVVQSVHSFSDSTIGPLLLGFFGVVVVTGVGLIAWRGDRLHSAGGIDSPVSREGAFLANNVLFVGFAFVVLLGTVFPLLYEALNPSSSVTVGAPVLQPVLHPGGTGPALPDGGGPGPPVAQDHRRGDAGPTGGARRPRCAHRGGLRPGRHPRHRAAAGLRARRLRRRIGRPGPRALGAGRLPRRPHRAAPHRPARPLAGWRGFVGRANGGMVVHIGVVVIAIGLAAATSFLHRGELHLAKGQSASFAGHTVTFVGTRQVTTPSHSAFEAVLHVDRGGMFYPAISQFGSGTQAVGTPAIDSSWRDDLYLTIDSIPSSGGTWAFGVVEQPLVMWLWIGAVLVGIGSVLSAIPGRRRRPTDPVSTPVVAISGPSDDDVAGPDRGSSRPEPEEAADPLPVGAGDPG